MRWLGVYECVDRIANEEMDRHKAAERRLAESNREGMVMVPNWSDLYHELLYAVGNKHPGETRHQTALRYIQQAERGSGQCDAKAAPAAGEKEKP